MSLSIYFFHTLHDTTLGQGRKCHFQGIFFLHYMIPLRAKCHFQTIFSLHYLVQPSGKDKNITFTLLSQLWDNDGNIGFENVFSKYSKQTLNSCKHHRLDGDFSSADRRKNLAVKPTVVYPPSKAKANYKGVYYKQKKRKNNQGLTLHENGKKMLNQKKSIKN